MRRSQGGQSLSRSRIYLFYFIFCASLVLVSLLAAEGMLRVMGKGPWVREKSNIIIEPEGRLYAEHPTLGYVNKPGQFKITLPTSYMSTATYLNNTLRITHPLDTYSSEQSKPEIWIFGCSFTHGQTLNDDETYPWVLQKNMPQYEIVNFGVDGYSTLQSLIQFQEALKKRKKPRFAIIAYAHFHDERNTFARRRRKQIAAPRQEGDEIARPSKPYAWLSEERELTYAMTKVEYHGLPLIRYSTSMNFLDDLYNHFADRYDNSYEVSQALIREFSDVAKRNGIELIVAGIAASNATRRMLRYAKSEGIMITDISVDGKIKENSNLPHDPHPSAIANEQYAIKLKRFLEEIGA